MNLLYLLAAIGAVLVFVDNHTTKEEVKEDKAA